MSRLYQVGVLSLLVVVAPIAVSDQQKAPPTRLAKVEQLMSGMVHPSFLTIRSATKEPKVPPHLWPSIATNAALLNEAGHSLVEGSRSKGPEWDVAAEGLRRISASMLAQISARNSAGVRAELKALDSACVNCHATFR